jgi:hypothetical protein
MGIQTASRTVKDISDHVKRQFGDESGVQLTDADILRWINDGQRDIAVKNHILTARASTSVIPGQNVYDFDLQRILNVDAIHVNGVPVEYMQFPDVEQYISGQDPERTREGRPLLWYSYANQITLWPKPIEAGTLTIYYVREPDPATGPSDTLAIPDRYYSALLQYVLAQAYEMDEDWQAASNKLNQFSGALNDLADEESSASGQTYPTITIVDY